MGSWKNSRLHRWEIQVAEWEQQAAFTGIQRTRSWTCMHYVVGLTHPRLIPRLHPGLVAYCNMKIYTWRTLVVSNYWTSCTGLTFDPKIPLEIHQNYRVTVSTECRVLNSWTELNESFASLPREYTLQRLVCYALNPGENMSNLTQVLSKSVTFRLYSHCNCSLVYFQHYLLYWVSLILQQDC